jgi:hypothetical protein
MQKRVRLILLSKKSPYETYIYNMLITELHTHLIPEIFSRFEQIIGKKVWLQRVKNIKDEFIGNPFLRDYLIAENNIAFQLAALSELAKKYGGRLPVGVTQKQEIYPACCFAVQVLSFADALPKKDGERFLSRIHGAFRNPDDMRGLQLEMAVATHFIRRGRRVSWPEITEASRFDLLVEDVGSKGLEVECKSISDNKGCKIHEREIREFLKLLYPNLNSTITGLSCGLSVILTLPNRIPNKYKDRQQLAKEVGSAIFSGQSKNLADGSSIKIKDFDVSKINTESLEGQQVIRALVDKLTGTYNRHVAIFGKHSGILALVVQSAEDDDFLGATFDTLSKAAREQLSGSRAGMMVAEFSGVSAKEMLSIWKNDRDSDSAPSALQVRASKFLSSANRTHVVSVAFLSSGSLRPITPEQFKSDGVTYHFPNEGSIHWSNDFKDLFSWASP